MVEEKENTHGFVPLESIVYMFLDMSDRGEESYRKAYNMAIAGYREMMMDVAGGIQTAVINVLANKTGKLPADYSNYTRVGVPNSGSGRIATFSYDNELSSFDYLGQDRLTDDNVNTYDGGSILNDQNLPRDTYFLGYSFSSLGTGSVNEIGSFKIEKKAGYILFDPNITYNQVIMEYMPDVNCQLDDYLIDQNASQAILDFLIWRWNWLRKDISVSEKMIQRKEYYNQKRLARQRMRPITLADINDAGRRGVKAAPKA